MRKYRVRQVWLPKHSFYASGYLPRNLGRLIECEIEFVDEPRESVDAEVVGVFSNVPNLFRRNRDKIIKSVKYLTGFPYLHGGLNKDIAESYDMKNPPNTKGFSKRVWLTTENIRPPHGLNYDFTISFDQDTYSGNNIYGPLAYLLMTESPSWIDPILGKSIDTESMTLPRRVMGYSNKKLACAFIGNSHSVRLRFIDELRKYGQVDVYGSAVGRPVSDKLSIARNYRFVICFENDIYPGYVTEKLIHAYSCDAIPIYWGDLGRDQVFNRLSFVNLNNWSSIEELANHIGTLDENEYERIFREPLIKNLSPLDYFKREICRVFTGDSADNFE